MSSFNLFARILLCVCVCVLRIHVGNRGSDGYWIEFSVWRLLWCLFIAIHLNKKRVFLSCLFWGELCHTMKFMFYNLFQFKMLEFYVLKNVYTFICVKKEYMYICNIYNIYKIYNQKYIFQKYEIHIHMYNFIQIIS